MKKIPLSIAKFFLSCIFLCISNVSAGEIQYNIKAFHDESAQFQIQNISESRFTHSSGEIRQAYQSGNLWMRIELEKWQPNLFLYLENPAIDEAFIFLKDSDATNSFQAAQIPLHKLLHGYSLHPINTSEPNKPFIFYLSIKTSSAKQFNVLVLSDAEVRHKEYTKYAILGSQLTAAVILMIWVVMQNWLARSKIFITVVLSTSMFILSRVNYFGFFLNENSPDASLYLILNIVLFCTLISGVTLMVKESFGRLFSQSQNNYFLALFVCSLAPPLGLIFDLPRAHLVMAALTVNFVMVATLLIFLRSVFSAQRDLIWRYNFQLIIFATYSLMTTLPGLYFVAPQIFPFTLGIPTYRDYFYPVLAFLIMSLMLNEQKEKEMDALFKLAVTKANADLDKEKNKKQHLFLGMLLHEIKTPLSVIKFGAAALTKEVTQSNVWTARVDVAADAINHIMNQCLLADKFEFGLSGYTAERVEVRSEISKLVERIGYLNPTYHERIEWQINDDITTDNFVLADPVFLRSILENLMTNALKYSAVNSKIHLSAMKQNLNNVDFVQFQIKNQIGKVGPPQIDKLFLRYYRAETAQGYSGTGLGLWLANQQATEMGSSIQCTFDAVWTTFSFQLPLLETRT